jgi:hypothetical protein
MKTKIEKKLSFAPRFKKPLRDNAGRFFGIQLLGPKLMGGATCLLIGLWWLEIYFEQRVSHEAY